MADDANPFDAPQAEETPVQVEAIALGDVLGDAFRGLVRNAGPLLGAAIVGVVVYYAGFCTIIGWLWAIPTLMFGFGTLMLESARGHTRFDALWAMWEKSASPWSVWGLLLLFGLAGIPGYLVPSAVIGLVAAVAFPGALHDPQVFSAVVTLGIGVGSSLWGVVTIRLAPGIFFLVDQQMGAVDSLTASWQKTRPIWGSLVLLQLAMLAFSLPGTVFTTLVQNELLDVGLGTDATLGMTIGVNGMAFVFLLLYYAALAVVYDRLEKRD